MWPTVETVDAILVHCDSIPRTLTQLDRARYPPWRATIADISRRRHVFWRLFCHLMVLVRDQVSDDAWSDPLENPWWDLSRETWLDNALIERFLLEREPSWAIAETEALTESEIRERVACDRVNAQTRTHWERRTVFRSTRSIYDYVQAAKPLPLLQVLAHAGHAEIPREIPRATLEWLCAFDRVLDDEAGLEVRALWVHAAWRALRETPEADRDLARFVEQFARMRLCEMRKPATLGNQFAMARAMATEVDADELHYRMHVADHCELDKLAVRFPALREHIEATRETIKRAFLCNS